MGILACMRGLAARGSERDVADMAAGLGTSMLAVRAGARAVAADGSVAVNTADGTAWLVSVRSVRCLVVPFAPAPEIGLRIDYCFDPCGDHARFALLLESEADRLLPAAAIEAALQAAVQSALQGGVLELPPCTTDEEWHAFRAGLNELVYTRFGLVVEDCLPVDLHPATDFAAQLLVAATAASDGAPASSGAFPDGAAEPDVAAACGRVGGKATLYGAGAASRSAIPRAGAMPAGAADPHHSAAPHTGAMPPGAAGPASVGASGANAISAADTGPNAGSAPLDAAMAAGAPPAAMPDGDSWRAWVNAEDVPLHALRAAAAGAQRDAAGEDSRALRRLFLELPALASGFRALPMREGDGSFAPMQGILRRLSLAALAVSTMPSLAMAAPGRTLPRETQQLRALHAVAAQSALDEAWAMLAAMRCGLDTSALDDIDRILSNLEYSLVQRRAAVGGGKP